MPAPLVTICVTSYRRPSLLLHAVLSCFQQDYRPLEIDIGDDSPTSEAIDLVQALVVPEEVTIRYRHNKPRLGEVENTNRLFLEARGEYLVLLHDDDAMLPGSVSSMMRASLSNPRAVLVFGMQYLINNEGEIDLAETKVFNQRHSRTADTPSLQNDILTCALKHRIPNNGYLLSARLARSVLYRSHEEIGLAADLDFAIRLGLTASAKEAVFLPAFTSIYRATTVSASSRGGVFLKIFDYLKSLEGLDDKQEEARQERLAAVARFAVVDNLAARKRLKAAGIVLSAPYWHQLSLLMCLYHLLLFAFPTAYELRRYVKIGPARRV